MLIKNLKTLSITKERKDLLTILDHGIKQVLPANIIKNHLTYNKKNQTLTIHPQQPQSSPQQTPLSFPRKQESISLLLDSRLHGNDIKKRLFIIGCGKATGLMAKTIEEIIPPNLITAGTIITNVTYKTKKIQQIKATHPIPNKAGVIGTQAILELKAKYHITANDTILCLISGGGSALMPCPVPEISLIQKQNITKSLLSCGANITEINTIRKHLSQTKGGKLAEHFAPAKIITLILSDVLGNDLSSIASGPTASDPSTFQDCLDILAKYNLSTKIATSINKYFNNGLKGQHPDTPKKLTNTTNIIIGDNNIALTAMSEKADTLGYKPLIITSNLNCSVETAAEKYLKTLKLKTTTPKTIYLLSTEPTVTLPQNSGQGGRNQHTMALLLNHLKKQNIQFTATSIGTDGQDYIKEAAGAIIDNATVSKLVEKEIDIESYISRFDSYNLFKKIDNCLIETGPTSTNICDLVILSNNT